MANILVVDDDPSIVELLQVLLTREGHTVSSAQDGKMGLALAQAKYPDLMILDVMMPEMDGFTVSGELFKDPATRAIPIMILTAKGNTAEIFSLVPNVSMILNKPFDPPELLKLVRQLLLMKKSA